MINNLNVKKRLATLSAIALMFTGVGCSKKTDEVNNNSNSNSSVTTSTTLENTTVPTEVDESSKLMDTKIIVEFERNNFEYPDNGKFNSYSDISKFTGFSSEELSNFESEIRAIPGIQEIIEAYDFNVNRYAYLTVEELLNIKNLDMLGFCYEIGSDVDTLWNIYEETGVSVDYIAKYNKIEDARKIANGKKIYLPVNLDVIETMVNDGVKVFKVRLNEKGREEFELTSDPYHMSEEWKENFKSQKKMIEEIAASGKTMSEVMIENKNILTDEQAASIDSSVRDLYEQYDIYIKAFDENNGEKCADALHLIKSISTQLYEEGFNVLIANKMPLEDRIDINKDEVESCYLHDVSNPEPYNKTAKYENGIVFEYSYERGKYNIFDIIDFKSSMRLSDVTSPCCYLSQYLQFFENVIPTLLTNYNVLKFDDKSYKLVQAMSYDEIIDVQTLREQAKQKKLS